MNNPSASNHYIKKIVVLGSQGCGKTRMIKSYIELTENIEAARIFRSMALSNIDVEGTNYGILIFEAPSHMDNKPSRVEMYKEADVILLCYAIEDLTGFLCVTSLWYREVKEIRPDVPLILVANKVDIRSIEPPVPSLRSHSNGRLTASNIRAAGFVECSSNTKEGILNVFKVAVKATIK